MNVVPHRDLERHLRDVERRRGLDQDLLIALRQLGLASGIERDGQLIDDAVQLGVAVAHPVGDRVGAEEQVAGVAGVIHVPQQVAHPGVMLQRAELLREDRGGLRVDVHGDADVGERILQDDRDLLDRGQAGGYVERELESVPVAGLGQQRGRLVRVERVRPQGAVVVLSADRNRAGRHQRIAAEDPLRDRLVRHRVRQRLADAHVIERRALHVEAEDHLVAGRDRQHLHAVGAAQGAQLVGGESGGDIDLSLAQQQRPVGRVGDDLQDDLLEEGRPGPVVGVGAQHHLHAGLPAFDVILAGADVVLGQPARGPGIVRLDVGLRLDVVHRALRLVAKQVEEPRAGVRELQRHLMVAGLLIRGDAGGVDVPGGAGFGSVRPLEPVDEVVGGQLAAGPGKGHALPDIEHDRGLIVRPLPRLHGGPFDHAGIGDAVALTGVAPPVAEELVVDVQIRLVRALKARERRVERFDVARYRDYQDVIICHGCGAAERQRRRQRGHQQWSDTDVHSSLLLT